MDKIFLSEGKWHILARTWLNLTSLPSCRQERSCTSCSNENCTLAQKANNHKGWMCCTQRQRVFVLKKKLLHPKLNSEQSLHEVIAGMGACSLSSRTSDCCLDGSQQTRLSEMFFCWILKSGMVIAIDCLHKKHLLPSLCTEACPVWPFLQE